MMSQTQMVVSTVPVLDTATHCKASSARLGRGIGVPFVSPRTGATVIASQRWQPGCNPRATTCACVPTDPWSGCTIIAAPACTTGCAWSGHPRGSAAGVDVAIDEGADGVGCADIPLAAHAV